MIVLKPIDTVQVIHVIPRLALNSTNIELSIIDDITGNLLTYTSTSVMKGDYLEIGASVDGLVKDRFYTFRINETITFKNIYKDKIFVTDQVISQKINKSYSINKDQYDKVESNNDYIVI